MSPVSRGSTVLDSPSRPAAGTADEPILVPEADDEALERQKARYARLVAMHTTSASAPKRPRRAQRPGGRSKSYAKRRRLAKDAVPTMSTPTTRGTARVSLVLEGMETEMLPDMIAILNVVRREDRSLPSEVEHNSRGVVISKSHRGTGKGVCQYVPLAHIPPSFRLWKRCLLDVY